MNSAADILVNDVHSRLNPTRVARVVEIRSTEDARSAILTAGAANLAVCVSGGRHAMGGQQFATGSVLLDTQTYRGVRQFDRERGLIEVESGIQWPELISWLVENQVGHERQWGIRQKQTGADRLSIGGAVAANVHGRGLTLRPFIADVESLTLIDAAGIRRTCSRTENAELFALVCGGYGLFGFVDTVTVRLVRRHKVRRAVEIEVAERLMARFDERIADGYEFGDFQFALDPRSDDFLRRGIFSCYRPAPDDTVIPAQQRSLSPSEWKKLLWLAHFDKQAAWDAYSSHYLGTHGQVYWSDTHQLSTYIDDYHSWLDEETKAEHAATEIISELYVPREALPDFLAEAADDFRVHRVDCIYGTIRLIERDDESFLAWAKEPYACAIVNLHTHHTPAGIEHSADAFRRLIDMAKQRGGSWFLTYHTFGTRSQLLECYPQLPDFLLRKRRYDPNGRFQSEWYRHHVALLGRDP
ncbi:MAG TPA: FAD-binding oxidoreductase [Gemmatimonadaceae bacterium]|nr:FAD-binding oxidoreductase [Gemmatimonadaceae bacterium]